MQAYKNMFNGEKAASLAKEKEKQFVSETFLRLNLSREDQEIFVACIP